MANISWNLEHLSLQGFSLEVGAFKIQVYTMLMSLSTSRGIEPQLLQALSFANGCVCAPTTHITHQNTSTCPKKRNKNCSHLPTPSDIPTSLLWSFQNTNAICLVTNYPTSKGQEFEQNPYYNSKLITKKLMQVIHVTYNHKNLKHTTTIKHITKIKHKASCVIIILFLSFFLNKKASL